MPEPKLIVIKTVKQPIQIKEFDDLMETFRKMINDCIRIGIEKDIHNHIKLARECYRYLSQKYQIITYYILHAISKASGILKNRKNSIKRGFKTKTPYIFKKLLISSYGFELKNGLFDIPLKPRQRLSIPLNNYIIKILSNPEVEICSFTITSSGELCISYKKEVQVRNEHTTNFVGIDRNLRNITIGNEDEIKRYDLSKIVRINKNTRSIYSSFKRNDHRIRKKIYSKYGQRRKNKTQQILHRISKKIVDNIDKSKQIPVFENIGDIRKLYKKGNGQGKNFRGKMNSWNYGELKRQIEYKCNWLGISVVNLDVKNTYGSSSKCHRCGERIQYDKYTRLGNCCIGQIDRDDNAVINLANRGRISSYGSQGLLVEARKQSKDAESMEENLINRWCN